MYDEWIKPGKDVAVGDRLASLGQPNGFVVAHLSEWEVYTEMQAGIPGLRRRWATDPHGETMPVFDQGAVFHLVEVSA